MVSKGEMHWTTVASILIVVVGGVILFGFTDVFGNTLKHGEQRTSCQNSVAMKDIAFWKIGEINCKTNTLVIEDTDPKVIMRTVAEEAYWCWWQFKEGQADFQSLGIDETPWCFICTNIDFSNRVKEKYPVGISGFDSFLKETSLKPKFNGAYADYVPYQYLSNSPNPFDLTPLTTINTQKFSIAFAITRPQGLPPGIAYSKEFYEGKFENEKYLYGLVYGDEDIKKTCKTIKVQ